MPTKSQFEFRAANFRSLELHPAIGTAELMFVEVGSDPLYVTIPSEQLPRLRREISRKLLQAQTQAARASRKNPS